MHVFIPIRIGPAADEVLKCVLRRPHAPVSTPLAWSEVRPSLGPATVHLGNFRVLLKRKDPWAEFFKNRQPLRNAMTRLREI
jgi:DNA primase